MLVAVSPQCARRYGGAPTSRAVNRDRTVGGKFVEFANQAGEGDVKGAGDGAASAFRGAAHVEDQGLWLLGQGGEAGDTSAFSRAFQIRAGSEELVQGAQCASDVVESDAAEPHGGLVFAAGLGDQDDGAGG